MDKGKFKVIRCLIITFLMLAFTEQGYAQKEDFLFCVEQAIKAPSGHNTQPWLFQIKENSIVILPNFSRELSVVDPTHRELFISLGCAAQNLCIAARQKHYLSTFQISEKGVISVNLVKAEGECTDTLFEQIARRQTNRSVYKREEVSEAVLQPILHRSESDSVHLYAWRKNSVEFEKLRGLIYTGNVYQMTDPLFKNELKTWIRFNKKQSESKLDGLSYATFNAPNLPAFISKSIMNSFMNAKKQNKSDMKKVNSSSHLVLITTKDNTIRGWVKTGMSLERFLLETTGAGIAVSYMNQPCEIKELSDEIRSSFKIENAYPMLLLRIGYADPAPYSKRRPVNDVLLKD